MLELSNSHNEASEDLEGHRVAPGVNIQTSEGYTVQVDVTVLYRIADPLKVMQTIGPGRLFEDSAAIPRAQQDLRRALGELDAEDFYRGDKRVAKVHAAQKAVEVELRDKGIEVLQVLIRRYTYDQRYQHAIEQRKIQDQTVFKNEAEATVATATAEKDRVIAVGEAAANGVTRGDAEAQGGPGGSLRTQAARRGRTVGEARGSRGRQAGERGRYRGHGSENMVGLKMADVLKNTRVIVLPTDGANGTNPLDLKRALDRFDVKP